ncbi:MAG: SAM-dependent chlorinase/fluorinase [Elusimicrobia bacterium]|nr:SAM-dependent chlorinase/fluorinase [Elusimicrobiota bacterium]
MSPRKSLRGFWLAAALLAACAGPGGRRKPTVLFLTDFGAIDGAVAACKGVMLSIAPRARIVDLTHQTPTYDIETAGEVIDQALPFFPAGTVVVAVVDPGVGGARKALAARTKAGHTLVGPDNGLFTRILEREGLDRAVELAEKRYWRDPDATATFHGRDIFAPAGAHLAAGVPLESLGPSITPIRIDLPAARREGDAVAGRVRYVEDPYGNVVTDIPLALLAELGVRVGGELVLEAGGKSHRLPFLNTFGDVGVGKPLALPHSRGPLSFSINQGDFAKAYGLQRGDPVRIRKP